MGEETAEPLWQAKPTPLFYVLFRAGFGLVFLFVMLIALPSLVNPDRSLNAAGVVIRLIFLCVIGMGIWNLFKLVWESSSVSYELRDGKLIERVKNKVTKTGFPQYALAKSRHYCVFGHCYFEFRENRRIPPLELVQKLTFAPKPHKSVQEVDSGNGIYGIRKEDADRLQNVLQTLEV